MSTNDLNGELDGVRDRWGWKGFMIALSLFIYSSALWMVLNILEILWPRLPIRSIDLPVLLVAYGFILIAVVCAVAVAPHASRLPGVSRDAPDPVRSAHMLRVARSDVFAALRLEWVRKLFRRPSQ